MPKNYKRRHDPSKIIENALFKAAVLGILFMIFTQVALSSNAIKTLVKGTNEDIIPIEESSLNLPKGTVEIFIENYSKYKHIAILKNGTEIKNIFPEDNSITLEVFEGDVIEIDTTYYNDPINIKINKISKNIEIPSLGEEHTSSKNIVYLFKVKFQEID